MGIGSDSGVGMSSRARTGWQNRIVEAEALFVVRRDYVSKAANLVLSLVFEGEETGYDYNHGAWVHVHSHASVCEEPAFWTFSIGNGIHPLTVLAWSKLIWLNQSLVTKQNFLVHSMVYCKTKT